MFVGAPEQNRHQQRPFQAPLYLQAGSQPPSPACTYGAAAIPLTSAAVLVLVTQLTHTHTHNHQYPFLDGCETSTQQGKVMHMVQQALIQLQILIRSGFNEVDAFSDLCLSR